MAQMTIKSLGRRQRRMKNLWHTTLPSPSLTRCRPLLIRLSLRVVRMGEVDVGDAAVHLDKAGVMKRGRGTWLPLASLGAHTRDGEDMAGVVGDHDEGPPEAVLRKMEPAMLCTLEDDESLVRFHFAFSFFYCFGERGWLIR